MIEVVRSLLAPPITSNNGRLGGQQMTKRWWRQQTIWPWSWSPPHMCWTTLEHDEPNGDQHDATIVPQSDSPLLALPTELLIAIFLELPFHQILILQKVGSTDCTYQAHLNYCSTAGLQAVEGCICQLSASAVLSRTRYFRVYRRPFPAPRPRAPGLFQTPTKGLVGTGFPPKRHCQVGVSVESMPLSPRSDH